MSSFRCSRGFAGADQPASLFHDSRDRRGKHPRAHLATWSGILRADTFGGYGELYHDGPALGPVNEAGCFEHAKHKLFELADVTAAARETSHGERTGMIYPIALEALQRLDVVLAIERASNGKTASERLAA